MKRELSQVNVLWRPHQKATMPNMINHQNGDNGAYFHFQFPPWGAEAVIERAKEHRPGQWLLEVAVRLANSDLNC